MCGACVLEGGESRASSSRALLRGRPLQDRVAGKRAADRALKPRRVWGEAPRALGCNPQGFGVNSTNPTAGAGRPLCPTQAPGCPPCSAVEQRPGFARFFPAAVSRALVLVGGMGPGLGAGFPVGRQERVRAGAGRASCPCRARPFRAIGLASGEAWGIRAIICGC